LPLSRAIYKYLALGGMLFLGTTCSVEKNSATTRFYHGMTARYNIYFNGYESYKAGVLKVNEGYRDDYSEVLRVFEYSDPSAPSLCGADMERAIQKASKLISLKSITARPEPGRNGKSAPGETDITDRKEYNEWVDDSYLLIAKARFYRQEFNEAAAVLNYSINQANDPDIRTEASIWLARLYNETARYSESYRILSELDINGNTPKVLISMYNSTLADLYIKQKKYAEAVDPLQKTAGFASGKRQKYRMTYLLAQIYEHTGNPDRAISLYRDVVKMNPPYDVEFNARINIAGVFDVNSGNPADIMKELERMLRDTKNKDFLDQIYYAMGSLAMKEGNTTEALDLYRKSVAASTINGNQKGKSYLALADHFYQKPDFMKAGLYYDSTVFFLDQKFPGFSGIEAKSRNLNTVVSQLKIINEQDSLQKVAAMPESQRNALISGIINEIITAEAEGKTSEYASRYSLGQYYENEQRFRDNIEQEGKWYFYNQAALTFGRTEFKRRWNDRALEDNWRRNNKTRVTIIPGSAGTEETLTEKKDTAGGNADYRNPGFYLKNLPLNDSMLAISNEKITLAYLNAGKAYFEKLSDAARATEILEKLLARYPNDQLVPETLYTLFQVNKETNTVRSEAFRQRLLENYPETEFAKILSDPDYYAKKLNAIKMAERIYESAYSEYAAEQFLAAVSLCDTALKKYPDDQLAPKFMLLRAYSTARISDEKAFKDELSLLVKTWPSSIESKKASEIISYLNQKLPGLRLEEEKEIAMELFVADTTSAHFFIIIIANPGFNMNQAVFDVISYNIDNYTNNNYRTQGELIDKKYLMITVSGFAKYRQSMDYFKSFNTARIVRNPSASEIYSFIISSKNLQVLNTDRNPERYMLFFRENYLNEKN